MLIASNWMQLLSTEITAVYTAKEAQYKKECSLFSQRLSSFKWGGDMGTGEEQAQLPIERNHTLF